MLHDLFSLKGFSDGATPTRSASSFVWSKQYCKISDLSQIVSVAIKRFLHISRLSHISHSFLCYYKSLPQNSPPPLFFIPYSKNSKYMAYGNGVNQLFSHFIICMEITESQVLGARPAYPMGSPGYSPGPRAQRGPALSG